MARINWSPALNRWVVRWHSPDGGRPKRVFRAREDAEAFLPSVIERPLRKRGPKKGTRSGAENLRTRIQRNVEIDANGCWLWSGKKQYRTGYAVINIDQRTHSTHRISYEAFVGAIPEGLHLDHLCRVRHCVNPEHLEPVTPGENTRRSPIHISVIRAARTHCKQGHEFTPENTYRHGPGLRWRSCRACGADRKRGK